MGVQGSSVIYTVCLDPGAECGWALFRNGILILTLAGSRTRESTFECLSVLHDRILEGPPGGWVGVDLVCEMPQIYTYAKSKGNPNGLLKLALQVGWAQGWSPHWRECVLYVPRRWKGNVKKVIHNNRVMKALHPTERGEVVSRRGGKPNDNVIDAVGLGLFRVKRMRV